MRKENCQARLKLEKETCICALFRRRLLRGRNVCPLCNSGRSQTRKSSPPSRPGVTCNGSDSAIVIGEFTRVYFFAFFSRVTTHGKSRGSQLVQHKFIVGEKKGVRHADLRSPKCAPPDRLYRPNLRKHRQRRVPRCGSL